MTQTTTAPHDGAININVILFALAENFNRATAVAEGMEVDRETLATYVADGLTLADKIAALAESLGQDDLTDESLCGRFYNQASNTTMFLFNTLRRRDGLEEIAR
jgi:hypothetical protein